MIQAGPIVVFAAVGTSAAAIAAPEGLRSLVEEISGLSVGALLLLVVYALMRGWFRLNREVEEMKEQRDTWKRLWEQEKALNTPSPSDRYRAAE